MYLGSWKIDDNLTFPCNTHSPTTGAGTDADSVPSYRVYEDETGTPLLTGSMAKLDDANTVGFYSEQIALSAANGFEKGKSYTIYISATVSSVTGTMSHSFQLEAEVDANRINWGNVDNPTTTVGLSGTSIKTATDVETDTADIQTRIGAAGAGLTALPWNAAWDAEVQSEVQDAIEANHLDHLLAVDYDPASKPGVATALLNELVENDGSGVSRFTATALEEAPSGSGVGDWTADEKEQIRYRLQLDGTQTAPAADAPLQMPVSADAIYQDSFTAEGLYKVFNIAGEGIQANVMKWRGGTPAILEGQLIKTHVIELNDDAKLEIEDTIFDALLSGHTTAGTAGERLGRIPNAAAGGNGGLPTVNASNQVAGVSGNVVGSIGSLAAQAKADVNAEMDSALADYDPPTHAELTAALAALNNLSAAEVQTKIEEFWQQFQLPELAAGQSPAEATPAEIMAFLWMYFRGPQESEKTGETTGIQRVHNDAGDIVLDAAFTKTETEYSREKLSLGD